MKTVTLPFSVNNTSSVEVVVYSTSNPGSTNANPPSQSADDYMPVYEELGTVASGQTGAFDCPLNPGRIVMARASDQFPMALAVIASWDSPQQRTLQVTDNDLSLCQQAFALYKEVTANVYEPLALQFHDLLINTANVLQLPTEVANFLNSNGYPNVTYYMFSMVSYWATSTLYAFPGTYYVYEPQSNNNQSNFILPTRPTAIITISNGTAVYQPADRSPTLTLTQSCSQLTSANASSTSGLSMTGIVSTLTWEGKPSEIVYCYVGTFNGVQAIAQPYPNPSTPWWVITYDMAYLSFELLQLGMALEMAESVLSKIPAGISWLAENAGNLKNAFIKAVRNWINETGDEASPASAAGDDVDPINTDIDTDNDTDNDTDIDVDVDLDIDVDIDIDIDVDFFAVVDVDVDVDIDNDTDTDSVTDIDTDIDIDTDVDVQPGLLAKLLQRLGKWLMDEGIPMLMEQLEIQFAMTEAQKLLNIWKQQDEQSLANMQPRQTSGLGLLLNYMLNPNNAIATRWNTFADYVQQSSTSDSSTDSTSIQTVLVSILAINNAAADQAASNWHWSTTDENTLISEMAQYTGNNTYQAFQALGNYTYNGQALPVKVGCQMAIKYLKQTA